MKKLTAIILAVLLLCSTLALSSCTTVFENLMDMVEDKMEDKVEDGKDKAKESKEADESEQPVKVSHINGKSVKEVYEQTQLLLLRMTEYELEGEYVFSNTKTGDTKPENKTNFKSTVSKNSAYSKKVVDGTVREYYYVNDNAYTLVDGALMSKETNADAEYFVDKNVYNINIKTGGMANWVDAPYLYYGQTTFTKLGNEYTLELSLTSNDAKEYYEETVDLDDINSASVDLSFTFDSNGKVKSYGYNSTVVYNDSIDDRTAEICWNIDVIKTEGVAEVTLPSGIETNNGGNNNNTTNNTPITVVIDGVSVTIGDMDGDGDVDDLDVFIQE